MTSIAEVGDRIKMVLGTFADEAARATHFTQRESKLTGSRFVQTLVLGWLHDPQASVEALAQVAAALGVSITPQGLQDRFGRQAVALMKRVLSSVVSQVISVDPVAIPLLRRFTAVLVQDSTIIPLPDALVDIWPGCGNGDKESASLKVQIRMDMCTGALEGPSLGSGRTHDRSFPLKVSSVPAGGLWMGDLGFFSLDNLGEMDDQGAFFLSRLKVQTAVVDEEGNPVDLLELLESQGTNQVDIPIYIGVKHRLAVRLLAVRVEEEVANQRRRKLNEDARRRGQKVSKARLRLADWTIYGTNTPVELLSLKEALVLARTRWQIELIFKLWKEHGQVDQWRSVNPSRILCEVYAKLTAMVIQHWLLLVSCWTYPHRSLVKGSQTVRSYSIMLVSAMAGVVEITTAISQIQRCLAQGCRINRRRKRPNNYQLLLHPDHA